MTMQEDMNRVATYGDICQLEQKFDQKFGQMDQKFHRLAVEHAKLCGTVWDMKNELLQSMREFKSEILGAVNKFHDDVVMIDRRERILKDRADKLDDRVKFLEEKRA